MSAFYLLSTSIFHLRKRHLARPISIHFHKGLEVSLEWQQWGWLMGKSHSIHRFEIDANLSQEKFAEERLKHTGQLLSVKKDKPIWVRNRMILGKKGQHPHNDYERNGLPIRECGPS